jgi:peptidyl-prolyl cis-trans isomerase SurA
LNVKRIVLFFLLLLAIPASAELVDRVAAVVNNDIITLSEVEARAAPELARLQGVSKADRAEAREKVLKHALDDLIGEKLMEAQIRDLAIDVTDAEVELGLEDVRKQNNVDADRFEQMLAQEGLTMDTYKVFMKKHLARMKLINLKVRGKVKVSDEDLKAAYNQLAHDESKDFEVHARHILLQLDPTASAAEVEAAHQKALAIAKEARQPGVDFAALAKQKSEGPSKSDGGDLGFFRRGVMVAEFERAAFTLPVGGVSDPVRTKFGWHVIKVVERRALAVAPFAEMKDQLRGKLLQGQLEKYTDQYVQELRAAAVVDVKL